MDNVQPAKVPDDVIREIRERERKWGRRVPQARSKVW
jgi:hypothetical protein